MSALINDTKFDWSDIINFSLKEEKPGNQVLNFFPLISIIVKVMKPHIL